MGYFLGSIEELVQWHFVSVQVSNALMGVSASVEVLLITMVGRQLDCGEKDIANFVAFLSVCRVLPGIPTGMLSECIDLRWMMLLSVVGQVVGSVLTMALLPSIISLWVFCVFTGLSVGVFFLARHIYVARLAKEAYRGITFSCLAGALRWSHVLGPILLGAAAAVWHDGRHYFSVPLVTALSAFACMAADLCCASAGAGEEETARDESKRLLGATLQGTLEGAGASHKDSVAAPSYDSITDTHAEEENSSHRCPTAVEVMPSSQEGNGAVDAWETNGNGGVAALCSTIAERWSVIWRLGLYTILYVALRANRKLLLTFAAMRIMFTDSELAFLLSFSFLFDALLFPLGGFITDVYGRRWAMVPAVLGLGVGFVLLPALQTPLWLYTMAGVFGAADALSCGLILTLIADQAPKKFAGTFFGVMRTVQDLGHVMASTVVAAIISKVDFALCCYLWGAVSVFAALWARFMVPVKGAWGRE